MFETKFPNASNSFNTNFSSVHIVDLSQEQLEAIIDTVLDRTPEVIDEYLEDNEFIWDANE